MRHHDEEREEGSHNVGAREQHLGVGWRLDLGGWRGKGLRWEEGEGVWQGCGRGSGSRGCRARGELGEKRGFSSRWGGKSLEDCDGGDGF